MSGYLHGFGPINALPRPNAIGLTDPSPPALPNKAQRSGKVLEGAGCGRDVNFAQGTLDAAPGVWMEARRPITNPIDLPSHQPSALCVLLSVKVWLQKFGLTTSCALRYKLVRLVYLGSRCEPGTAHATVSAESRSNESHWGKKLWEGCSGSMMRESGDRSGSHDSLIRLRWEGR